MTPLSICAAAIMQTRREAARARLVAVQFRNHIELQPPAKCCTTAFNLRMPTTANRPDRPPQPPAVQPSGRPDRCKQGDTACDPRTGNTPVIHHGESIMLCVRRLASIRYPPPGTPGRPHVGRPTRQAVFARATTDMAAVDPGETGGSARPVRSRGQLISAAPPSACRVDPCSRPAPWP